jgi:hypothetical protein
MSETATFETELETCTVEGRPVLESDSSANKGNKCEEEETEEREQK